MLTIRAEQMQELGDVAERRFARRLTASLRQFFPFRFAEAKAAAVEEFALGCIAHAKALGLNTESSITRYANICALLGVGFEVAPWGISAGLAPRENESRETVWLDRIVPLVAQRFRDSRPG